MDIETNKSSGEEEYRPADYDSSVFEATPAAGSLGKDTAAKASVLSGNKAANILEHLKRKNIIIAALVLVGIFCVYKIVDVLFTPSAPRHKAPPAIQTPAQVAQPAIQAPPAVPAEQNKTAVAVSSVVERLNTMEQHINMQQSNLSSVSTQINELQTAVNNMDSKISNLTASMQAMTAIMAKQQAAMTAKQTKRKTVQAAPKPIYYVKAMVPGRAWLTTSNGATMTVSLGNDLPGYGRVEVIDPNQGTLITSTGAIIGYSPGDS